MRERPTLKLQVGAALLLLALVFGFSHLSGTGAILAAPAAPAADGKGLTAFRSDAELSAFLRRLRKRQPEPPAAMADMAFSAPAEMSAAQAPAAESASNGLPGITNVQEAGVDEGGIVKVHRDNLVILRRGRCSRSRSPRRMRASLRRRLSPTAKPAIRRGIRDADAATGSSSSGTVCPRRHGETVSA